MNAENSKRIKNNRDGGGDDYDINNKKELCFLFIEPFESF